MSDIEPGGYASDEAGEDAEPPRESGAHAIPLTMTQLYAAELVLVWGVRQWVDDHKRKTGTHKLLYEGFERAGALRAFMPFDALLTLTARRATRSLDVRCLKCRGVGDGEVDVLSVVSLMQLGRPELSCQRLSTWLPGLALRYAVSYVETISTAFSEAGLVVRPRVEYLTAGTPPPSVDAHELGKTDPTGTTTRLQ